jgi:uncharacterized protein YjbI with pentapeptide repeats
MSQIFTGLLSAVLAFLLFLPSPVFAASSAATRANDDLKLSGNDFSGQNLQEAEFAEARLSGANFSKTKLEGVVFNGSNLSKANFQDANLSYGFAYLTSFIEADFRNAILLESTFLQCSLRDADITGADFSGSIIDKEQLVALCKVADGVNPVTGVSTRESLECR